MRSVIPMRTAKTGYIIMSAVLILFGLFVTLDPALFSTVLGVVIGISMILFGVVKVIGYFSKDLFRLAFQYDLAFGILLAALGVIVLTEPDNLISFLCIAIGIAILADGLFKIQMSMDAKQFGLSKWWLVLSVAIITGLIGLVLIFKPVEGSYLLIRILGIALMAEGIMSIVTVLTSVKIVKHQKPDVIEGEWREL